MKKLIAILFLSLICLTTLSGGVNRWDMCYELQTDSEDLETENKESKTELKEFTLGSQKKTYAAPSLTYSYKVHHTFLLPCPVLDQHTPPPDRAS